MARPSDGDLMRGSTDLVVLSVLADQPLYGYGIIKQVSSRSGGALRLSAGRLYPLLHELEQEGLLLSTWDDAQSGGGSGGRRRKWYRLSAKGRRRLARRIAAHRAWREVVDAFLPDREGA